MSAADRTALENAFHNDCTPRSDVTNRDLLDGYRALKRIRDGQADGAAGGNGIGDLRRVALTNELRDVIEAWAAGPESRRSMAASRTRVEQDEANAQRHLDALRNQVCTTPPRLSPRETQAAVAALNRLENLLAASGRWDLSRRKLPGRPAEKRFRDDLRATLRRHHVDARTGAWFILQYVAPSLPKAAQAALLGPWQTKPKQVRYLADKWLRRTH